MYSSKTISGRERSGLALFALSFFLFFIIIGGSIFQIMVEIPNWASGSRAELESFRGFFRHSHPGYFFRVIVPLTLLSLIASALLLRGRPAGAGKKLLLVLAGLVATEVFTFGYFMPRNFMLFLNPLSDVSDDVLRQTVREWLVADRVRSVLLLVVAAGYGRAALFLARSFLAVPAGTRARQVVSQPVLV